MHTSRYIGSYYLRIYQAVVQGFTQHAVLCCCGSCTAYRWKSTAGGGYNPQSLLVVQLVLKLHRQTSGFIDAPFSALRKNAVL